MAKGKIALVSLMVLGGILTALPANARGVAFDDGCNDGARKICAEGKLSPND